MGAGVAGSQPASGRPWRWDRPRWAVVSWGHPHGPAAAQPSIAGRPSPQACHRLTQSPAHSSAPARATAQPTARPQPSPQSGPAPCGLWGGLRPLRQVFNIFNT